MIVLISYIIYLFDKVTIWNTSNGRLAIIADGDLGLHIAGGAVGGDAADEVVDSLRVGLEVERSLGGGGVGDAGAVLVLGLGHLNDVVAAAPLEGECLS